MKIKILAMPLSKLLHRYPLSKIILLGFLLGLIGIGAVPGYFAGNWRWASPPPVPTLEQLKGLRKTGLTIAGWQTLQQDTVLIGGHNWLLLEVQHAPQTKALILLLPQSDPSDQPQVEWTDVSGLQRWILDSYSQMQFTVAVPHTAGSSGEAKFTAQQVATVQARFLRARNERQTYAVLQWYAWPNGGHPAPSQWFWADRRAQLSNRRVPWVAVSIQISIEPFGNIERSRQLAESLGKTVQAALMAGPLENL